MWQYSGFQFQVSFRGLWLLNMLLIRRMQILAGFTCPSTLKAQEWVSPVVILVAFLDYPLWIAQVTVHSADLDPELLKQPWWFTHSCELQPHLREVSWHCRPNKICQQHSWLYSWGLSALVCPLQSDCQAHCTIPHRSGFSRYLLQPDQLYNSKLPAIERKRCSSNLPREHHDLGPSWYSRYQSKLDVRIDLNPAVTKLGLALDGQICWASQFISTLHSRRGHTLVIDFYISAFLKRKPRGIDWGQIWVIRHGPFTSIQ